jgi:hypothetical protein
MKARLVLKPEEALLEPTAIMGDEEGIYFTFMSDLGVISSVLPEPLEPAFPLVSGYIVEIKKPSFGEYYREAMLGVYVNVNGTIGMYPLTFLLSGPGAEMATYLGREKTGLPKKLCENLEDISIERNGDVLRGTVRRKGSLLMDVSLKLGEYNDPAAGDIYNHPEPGKVTGGTSFYFHTILEPDETGTVAYRKVNLFSNEAQYTYKSWQKGKVSIRLYSSENDAWGTFPVFANMGGALSVNDLEMKELYVIANPDPQKTMPKLMSTRFDKVALVKGVE